MFVLLHLMGPPNKIASAVAKPLLLMMGSGAVGPIAPTEDVSDGRKSEHTMETTLPIVLSGHQLTAPMVLPFHSVKVATGPAMKISMTKTETMRVTDLTWVPA